MEHKMFPGLDGIPYRSRGGMTPNLKNSDPEHLRPALVTDMHVKVFDLTNEEDRTGLEQVLTRCAKGRAYQSHREQNFDPSTGSYKVLLIWGDFFYEDPQETRDGTTTYR
jgi:hypothetical protein